MIGIVFICNIENCPYLKKYEELLISKHGHERGDLRGQLSTEAERGGQAGRSRVNDTRDCMPNKERSYIWF